MNGLLTFRPPLLPRRGSVGRGRLVLVLVLGKAKRRRRFGLRAARESLHLLWRVKALQSPPLGLTCRLVRSLNLSCFLRHRLGLTRTRLDQPGLLVGLGATHCCPVKGACRMQNYMKGGWLRGKEHVIDLAEGYVHAGRCVPSVLFLPK